MAMAAGAQFQDLQVYMLLNPSLVCANVSVCTVSPQKKKKKGKHRKPMTVHSSHAHTHTWMLNRRRIEPLGSACGGDLSS